MAYSTITTEKPVGSLKFQITRYYNDNRLVSVRVVPNIDGGIAQAVKDHIERGIRQWGGYKGQVI